jgi:hypothetical protein
MQSDASNSGDSASCRFTSVMFLSRLGPQMTAAHFFGLAFLLEFRIGIHQKTNAHGFRLLGGTPDEFG